MQFIGKLETLEIIELVFDSIDKDSLNFLESVLVQKNKLKKVTITVKNYTEKLAVDKSKLLSNIQ